jgi:ribose 5-phosphate isomerase B
MTTVRIAFGADHGGYELKQLLIRWAKEQGHTSLDFGTDSTESCDYPVYVPPVVDALREGAADIGVLLCGSGIGVDMVANRHRGMRSALCHTAEMAQRSRIHNDANILSLGSRYITPEEAIKALDLFINTEFSNEERHVRRLSMIDAYM